MTGRLETVVRDRLGLDLGALGPAVCRRAVEHRMKATGVTTREAYLGVLAADPGELAALADELVVPESWFFRGGRSLFDRLADLVAAWAATRSPDKPVRALSLPCSTGEEPYSLAIALHEHAVPPERYTIDAADISAAHLARAAAGRFTAFAFRESGADIRPAHFRQVDDRWELLPHIRAAVRFRAGNATNPAFLHGEQPYDLILCRNLFIYLTPDARKQAMTTLERLLSSDGRLCLSPGEADRLPTGRFAADEPAELGVYRRADQKTSTAENASGAKRNASSRRENGIDGISKNRAHPVIPSDSSAAVKSASEAKPVKLETARQLADAGRLAEARAVCEQLTRGPDGLPGAYSLLGVILQAQGKPTEAAEAFRKALYLDPEHPEALGHMILICDRRGDAAQAAALRKRLARVTREGAG